MGAAQDFFDLEGGDSVAQDVTHVSAVPIEAFDLVQHAFSIYGYCIYTQTIRGVRSKTKTLSHPPAPARTNRCARPVSCPRCVPCGSPHPGIAGLPASRRSKT